MNANMRIKNIYLEEFRRLKVMGIVTLAVHIAVGLIIGFLFWALSHSASVKIENDLLRIMLSPSCALFIILLTFTSFGFLTKRNECDFYHAIPIKRGEMYLAKILAILSWYMLSLLGIMLVLLTLGSVRPASVGYILLFGFVEAIMIAGLSAMTASLSGSMYVNVIMMLIILVAPRLILTVSLVIFHSIEPTSINEIVYDRIINSNIIVQAFPISYSDDANEYASLAFSFGEAMLYQIIAYIAFVRRKSEDSQTFTPNKVIQTIMRTVVSFIVMLGVSQLVLNIIFNRTDDSITVTYYYAIIWLVVAIVVYFLYELVTSRKWDMVAKSLKTLPLLLAIVAIYIAGMTFGAKRFEGRNFSSDNVDMIAIYLPNGRTDTQDKVMLKSSEAIDKCCKIYSDKRTSNQWSSNVITFYVGNMKYYRELDINYYEKSFIYAELVNQNKITTSEYMALADWAHFMPTTYEKDYSVDGYELYATAKREIKEKNNLYDVLNVPEERIIGYIDFYCHDDYGERYIPISDKLPQTMKLLESIK